MASYCMYVCMQRRWNRGRGLEWAEPPQLLGWGLVVYLTPPPQLEEANPTVLSFSGAVSQNKFGDET